MAGMLDGFGEARIRSLSGSEDGRSQSVTRGAKPSVAIYVSDPDGNRLERYVDADPGIWRRDPSAVATSTPLEL